VSERIFAAVQMASNVFGPDTEPIMPASTLLLIFIGILSVCAFCVHILVRQHLQRETGHRRTPTLATPHDALYADWLKPSRGRELTSASV
jgi:hypothetical protein